MRIIRFVKIHSINHFEKDSKNNSERNNEELENILVPKT
jgi:hypothetical protein